ncbi:MAG TPA: class I SAM-dependent methyltransferase [Woeseiaceae bacterium]|nr:class I SAM-dependent methyltransferase [Woeseiaceae bacterium]
MTKTPRPAGGESSFKDHFSGHAESYAAYRPGYPGGLFDFLAACCERRRHAWDCATGNGQTAIRLTRYFERVTATDASGAQIEAATPHPKIDYRVATAEHSGLSGGSVDLVTVAQALHWFDIERFFAEAVHVLAPGGVLAVWSYGKCTVHPDIDAVVGKLYRDLDAWWPPERRMVDDRYRGIELPMPAIAAPGFEMTARWSVDAMLGYLRTWSASQRCLRSCGADPVSAVETALRALWDGGERPVCWPLTLKIGRKAGA